ncbi:MAG: hypothetical protein IPO90_08800 [Flavobacteriales bacterium]|nr:hypothetical protein [Flavobacteriales bacterium]
MKLDRTTYEAWLLDRIEGNLTLDQERELDAFLALNLDLDGSLGELPSIGAVESPFGGKSELKKSFPPIGDRIAERLDDFLVARLEGDLGGAQLQALDKFLYEHPEYAQEAKHMGLSKVISSSVAFTDKPSLERHFPPNGSPDVHRLTDFLIAEMEGDLTPEQHASLTAFLKEHPEAQRAARLVVATRVPQERIVFVNKEELKKREARVVAMWPRLAAAASIALIMGAAWWMLRGSDTTKEVAVKVAPSHQEPSQTQSSGVEPSKDIVPMAPETAVLPQQEALSPDGKGAVDKTGMSKSEPVHLKAEHTPAIVPAPSDPLMPESQQNLALEHVEPTVPVTEQVVAQVPEQASTLTTSTNIVQEELAGSTIPTLLANSIRSGMLETVERDVHLDGADAIAMVDKGVNAITGGQGGFEVQRTSTRDRVKLRLGHMLSITASKGR